MAGSDIGRVSHKLAQLTINMMESIVRIAVFSRSRAVWDDHCKNLGTSCKPQCFVKVSEHCRAYPASQLHLRAPLRSLQV